MSFDATYGLNTSTYTQVSFTFTTFSSNQMQHAHRRKPGAHCGSDCRSCLRLRMADFQCFNYHHDAGDESQRIVLNGPWHLNSG